MSLRNPDLSLTFGWGNPVGNLKSKIWVRDYLKQNLTPSQIGFQFVMTADKSNFLTFLLCCFPEKKRLMVLLTTFCFPTESSVQDEEQRYLL